MIQNKILLSVIFAGILVLGTVLVVNPSKPPFQRSAQPLLQALGVVPLGMNNFVSRVVSLDDMDEKAWSNLYRENRKVSGLTEEEFYLNGLISNFASNQGTKDFEYRVYLLEDEVPNAFALPGGNILFTRGLYNLLQTEAEIVAVLLHEMAHIERGHCLNLVRMEILRKKIRFLSSLETLEWMVTLFTRPSYQKTEEAEADAWAFDALIKEGYNPLAMSRAFSRLLETGDRENALSGSLITDYFTSHPDLKFRVEKYQELARAAVNNTKVSRWGEKPKTRASDLPK